MENDDEDSSKQVGLFLGSFNPIHKGHLYVANKILEETNLDEVWFVVSPQNPLKPLSELANEDDRLRMVMLSIESNPKFDVCNIEFKLSKPSYTYKTLNALSQKYNHKFTIIIGSDALNKIDKWKNYQDIISYPIVTLVRDNEEIEQNVQKLVKNLTILKSDSTLSSTQVRNLISNNEDISDFVSKDVISYIKDNELYG